MQHLASSAPVRTGRAEKQTRTSKGASKGRAAANTSQPRSCASSRAAACTWSSPSSTALAGLPAAPPTRASVTDAMRRCARTTRASLDELSGSARSSHAGVATSTRSCRRVRSSALNVRHSARPRNSCGCKRSRGGGSDGEASPCSCEAHPSMGSAPSAAAGVPRVAPAASAREASCRTSIEPG